MPKSERICIAPALEHIYTKHTKRRNMSEICFCSHSCVVCRWCSFVIGDGCGYRQTCARAGSLVLAARSKLPVGPLTDGCLD